MQTEATISANSGAATNKLTPDLSTLSQPSESMPTLDQRSPDNRISLLAPSNYSRSGSNQAQRHPGAF